MSYLIIENKRYEATTNKNETRKYDFTFGVMMYLDLLIVYDEDRGTFRALKDRYSGDDSIWGITKLGEFLKERGIDYGKEPL
jgi:hypothetical protein